MARGVEAPPREVLARLSKESKWRLMSHQSISLMLCYMYPWRSGELAALLRFEYHLYMSYTSSFNSTFCRVQFHLRHNTLGRYCKVLLRQRH